MITISVLFDVKINWLHFHETRDRCFESEIPFLFCGNVCTMKNVCERISFTFFHSNVQIFLSNVHKRRNVSKVTSINSLSSWFNQIFRHEFTQLRKTFDKFIIGFQTCFSEFTFQFHEFIIWLNMSFISMEANSAWLPLLLSSHRENNESGKSRTLEVLIIIEFAMRTIT